MISKKIIHVIPYFQPSYGYEEFYHAYSHSKLGIQVTVITSRFYHPNLTKGKKILVPIDEDQSLPFKVIRLQSIEFQNSSQNILLRLNSTIKRIAPHGLYLHGLECLTFYFIQRRLKFQLNTIIDVHKNGEKKPTDINSRFNLPYLLKNKLKSHIISKNLIGCNNLIFFSKSHKEDYYRQQKNIRSINAHSIEMPVDLTAFYVDERIRHETRQRFQISNNHIIVLITGRLTKSKGIKEIVDSFLKFKTVNMYLYLVGDIEADYKFEILSKCLNNSQSHMIRFFNKATKQELLQFYNACDYALWPYHMSVGILEALACGAFILTNKESKSYYGSIPDECVIEGKIDNYFQFAFSNWSNTDNKMQQIARKKRGNSVSNLSYMKLAKLSSAILLGN